MRRRFMTCRHSYNLDNYVNFTMLEDGIVMFRDRVFTDLQVSINGDAWESDLEPVRVKKGDILALKSYGYLGAESTVGHIGLPACNLGGNIMSLIYGDEAKDHSHELSVGQFQYLFNHTLIVNVEVDFLPATTLADSCYAHMFDGCTRLTQAPALPATTLADSCYAHMFDGCTSLVNVPELPATTLAENCYRYMFYGCTKLNYIKMLAVDISADWCLHYWVQGVASTGTFVKNKDATWDVRGVSGIPSNWKIEYDHNYDIGSDISFHIERIDETLYAKDWMTWDDWVHSKYNTVSARISGHDILIPSYSSYPLNTYPDNIIKNGGTYYFQKTGGGSSD